MTTPLSVGAVAKRLGLKPGDITRLFYDGRISDDLAPVVAGRRLIPEELVPVIAMELRRRGKLPPLPKRRRASDA